MRLIKKVSKIIFTLFVLAACMAHAQEINQKKTGDKMIWSPDNGNGTYKNPIIFADYSDPDVIRVGSDYYLTASSFNCVPALPVLHSRDLVNWKIIGYAAEQMPFPGFDKPQHGKSVWAPCIRYHDGFFWIYYGDPDNGIIMTKAKNPEGPWDGLKLIRAAKGWIDCSPLWDNDGNMYLVHAWAKSRAGFNSIVTVNKMSPDGTEILDDGITVFDANKNHPTMEGTKFHKRNGYYYIFAPAGGVPEGWQTVLRSKNVYGPYEDKIVLHQGNTKINGPHQGAWIDTESGDSWFIHFQDKKEYGRIVHLQPVEWNNDWPMIGKDINDDGIGEPVMEFKKPVLLENNEISIPQTSDDFNSEKTGLQWQWQANYKDSWYSLKENKNNLRLFSVSLPANQNNLWNVPNLLLQKFPAPEFSVITKLNFNPVSIGETCGLIIMGMDYSYVGIKKAEDGLFIIKSICKDADKDNKEVIEESIAFSENTIFFKVHINEDGMCEFFYSSNGNDFIKIGKEFKAKKGMWIGAKAGIFNITPFGIEKTGFSDYEWFNVE